MLAVTSFTSTTSGGAWFAPGKSMLQSPSQLQLHPTSTVQLSAVWSAAAATATTAKTAAAGTAADAAADQVSRKVK